MKPVPKYIHKDTFILDSIKKSYKRPEYNGLTDPNLSSFFSSPRRRKILVLQKLITPTGQINEKVCRQKITEDYLSNSTRKKTLSPLYPSRKITEYSKTPEDTFKQKSVYKLDKLPLVKPISSSEFKEILNKRRSFINNSN